MTLRSLFFAFGLATLAAAPVASAEAAGSTGRGEASDQTPGDIYALPASPLLGAPSFEMFGGGATLLILFEPDCAWCRLQFVQSEALKAERPDVAIAAVSLRGARKELIEELRASRVSSPAYRASGALIEALGEPDSTPRTYLIDPEGRVVVELRGKLDKDQLEHLVDLYRNWSRADPGSG